MFMAENKITVTKRQCGKETIGRFTIDKVLKLMKKAYDTIGLQILTIWESESKALIISL